MSPPLPRRRRSSARRTLRRVGWTSLLGLLLLAVGAPALRHGGPAAPASPAPAREALLTEALQLRSIADPWAEADRTADLVHFASQLDDPSSRRTLLETALPRWATLDPDAAFHWLARQPADADFDAGRAALASQLDHLASRIRDVADEAALITDPALYRDAFGEIVATWHLLDPSAAGERLARNDLLPDIERAHLQEILTETTPLL